MKHQQKSPTVTTCAKAKALAAYHLCKAEN